MAVVTVIWCVGLKCLFGSSIFICHGCLQPPATYYTHYHFGVCGCHSAFSSPSIKKGTVCHIMVVYSTKPRTPSHARQILLTRCTISLFAEKGTVAPWKRSRSFVLVRAAEGYMILLLIVGKTQLYVPDENTVFVG